MATVPAFRMPPERKERKQERTRLYPAAAIALVAEVLLLGGAFLLLTHKSPAPVEPPPTVLTLAAAATPRLPAPATPPKPPKPATPTPKPQVSPAVRPAVPMHHAVTRTPPPKPTLVPAPALTPVPPMPSAAPTEPAPAPRPVPAAPAPTAAPPTASPSFEGALRAAIQAALHYPESARMAGMSGRTRVAFTYRDGVASDVTVVVSSGMGLLDRAALAAVRDAAYPKPEAALVGKTLSEQVWVTFNLDDHD